MKRRGRRVRGKLVKRDGTKCTFECPNGHKSTRDYSKGPVYKRITGEASMAMMEHWWRQGISYECPKCLGT